MNELFSYYDGGLEDFVAEAMLSPGEFIKRVISDVSANLVEDLRQQGVIVDGVTYYVEEVRQGRRELAASTMYKRKKENSPTQMG